MNLILVQDRQDHYHLVDYCTWSGEKYALCGMTFSRKDIINTFALDMSMSGICTECLRSYNLIYAPGTAYHRRDVVGGRLASKLQQIPRYIDDEYISPAAKYEDLLDRRYWPKLQRNKVLMRRKPKK